MEKSTLTEKSGIVKSSTTTARGPDRNNGKALYFF